MDKLNKELLRECGFREDYDPNNRIVKQEDIAFQGITVWVSTVDLGIDHSFGGEPLYFETMAFKRDANGGIEWGELYCYRYQTRELAEKGHKEFVEALKTGIAKFVHGHIEI